MKKVLATIAAGILVSALVGCSSGEPNTIEPKTNDPIDSASSVAEKAPEKAETVISESGWSLSKSEYDESQMWVNYALILANTDKSNMTVNQTVKITVKDVNGSVIASETAYAAFVGPDDVMPVVGRTDMLSSEPADVTIELGTGQQEPASYDEMYRVTDFSVSGAAENPTPDGDMNWAGEFTNPSDNAMDKGVTPTVVLFNGGQIVGGFNNNLMLDAVAGGATTSFEIDPFGNPVPEHDSFEIYIVPNIF